jgi:predicted aspartyl protease
MSEKLTKILDFYKENNIDLPIDVKNALEDVFSENENVKDVDLYFKEDASLFGEDLILANEVKAHLNSPSEGSTNNVFTYYGEVEISMSEFVNLYDEDKKIEEVTNIDQLDRPTTINTSKYAIVLVESVKWKDGKIDKSLRLLVYCPEKIEEGEEE